MIDARPLYEEDQVIIVPDLIYLHRFLADAYEDTRWYQFIERRKLEQEMTAILVLIEWLEDGKPCLECEEGVPHVNEG
jgi:hypothetical protein